MPCRSSRVLTSCYDVQRISSELTLSELLAYFYVVSDEVPAKVNLIPEMVYILLLGVGCSYKEELL